MSISFDKALGIHDDAMALRAKRTEVLAQNLANADTPGYKARDIDFRAVLNVQQQKGQTIPMATSDGKHLGGTMPGPGEMTLLYRRPVAPSLDGNTVELHQEQAQFAENSMRHQASIQFLSGRIMGLMSAIKGEI